MAYSSRLPAAVHILMAVAFFSNDHKVTSEFLAESVRINPVMVRNTLGKLRKAGLVRTEAGIGGTFLAKDPAEITLLDIFRAVEPEEDLFRFHEHPNPACPVGNNIHTVLDGHLEAAQDSMRESLRSVTLADLMHQLDSCLSV